MRVARRSKPRPGWGKPATEVRLGTSEARRYARRGLDCVEPADIPAPDDPLWAMEQVIRGRHTSGSSPYNGERFLAGEPLQNVVDHARGY
jgi:hypothetical protein